MNVKSIKIRIGLFIVTAMMVLGFGVAFWTGSAAKGEILNSRMQQMSSIKISKMQHLKSYFLQIENIMKAQVSTDKTYHLMSSLDQGFKDLANIDIDINEARSALLNYY